MLKSRLYQSSIFLLALVPVSFSAFAAGDPINGKLLYQTTATPLVCANSGCHGIDVTKNQNNVLKGANSPTTIQNAINNGTGGMGMFATTLNATQIADIAAYIGNPNAGTPVPAVTLSTTSVAFGNQQVGTPSASRAVTLTNGGTGPLTLTSIAASGEFAQSNNCGASVAAGAMCTINVTFSPTSVGAKTGSITITDNATGSPHTVGLSGTGTAAPAPAVSFALTTLPFGSQAVNTISAAKAITLSNTGTAVLNVMSISASTEFTQTNNCGTSVPAGMSCTINVTFAPTSTGAKTGSISVNDNATGSPHSVSLAGTGAAAAAPVATLSATNLSFGNQTVNATSPAQTLTLRNTGNATLNVATVAVSGDFAKSGGTCMNGGTVAAGANCTIAVTFTPIAMGSRSGLVTFTDNAGSQTVTLQGAGVAQSSPTATLAPAKLTFGSQALNATSTAQTATLTNTSATTALTITGIAIGGSNAMDFAKTTACGTTLNAGASCSIAVAFKPTAAGLRTASLSLASNASGALSVALEGTGLASAAPVVSFDVTSLGFGDQTINAPSTAKTVKLSNTGTATLNIKNLTASGDFAQTNTCGTQLMAGANCTISMTFTPTMVGARTGELTLTSDAAGSPHKVTLSGNGVTDVVPSLSYSRKEVEFHDHIMVGTTSKPETVTLSNGGPGTLLVSAIVIDGPAKVDFAQTNDCATVAPKATCTISITFTPTVSGGRKGSLGVVSNAPGKPAAIKLAGEGTTSGHEGDDGDDLKPSTPALEFDAVKQGQASGALEMLVTNSAPLAVSVGEITVSSRDFSKQVDNCSGKALASGQTCNIKVSFTPQQSGARQGELTIANQTSGSQTKVALAGNALPAAEAALPATPSAAAASTGGSAGGCTVNPNAGFDLAFPILLALAGLYRLRRKGINR